MRLFFAIPIGVISLAIALAAAAVEVTLVGSPGSMIRQNSVAKRNRLAFVRVPADLARLVEEGRLTPVPGNGDYALKGVDLPFAHPVVRAFLERIARDYRRVCGEHLLVTSLVRPMTAQPPNAHPLSVHPAGIAVDLHIPDRPECRSFLERTLLALEERGLLDATEERSPPHLHVAVFPTAYAAHLTSLARDSARAAARTRPGWAPDFQPVLGRPEALAGIMLAVLAGAVAVWFLVRWKTRRRG